MAAYAAACAVWGVAMAVRDADVARRPQPFSGRGDRRRPRGRMDSALLARPGEFKFS